MSTSFRSNRLWRPHLTRSYIGSRYRARRRLMRLRIHGGYSTRRMNADASQIGRQAETLSSISTRYGPGKLAFSLGDNQRWIIHGWILQDMGNEQRVKRFRQQTDIPHCRQGHCRQRR